MKTSLKLVSRRNSDKPDIHKHDDGSVTLTFKRVPSEDFQIHLIPQLYIWRHYMYEYGAAQDSEKYLATFTIGLFFLLWRLDIELYNRKH